jgi:hypothetical protein
MTKKIVNTVATINKPQHHRTNNVFVLFVFVIHTYERTNNQRPSRIESGFDVTVEIIGGSVTVQTVVHCSIQCIVVRLYYFIYLFLY